MSRLKLRLYRWWKWLSWRLLIALVVTGLLGVLFGPVIQWYMRPTLPLDLLIVNYTMPHRNDRKHRALFWLLHHEKVKPPKGKAAWSALRDFVGYRPGRPPKEAETLSKKPHKRPQLLYLTDTYGVYRDDLKNAKRWLRPDYIDRSPKVFGGLTWSDARLIRSWVQQGTHLVVEFNSMCEPTGNGPRRLISRLVGMSWTGWVGKVFQNPRNPLETPRWLKKSFKQQFPKASFPSSPVLFLINRRGKLLYLVDPSVEKVSPRLVQSLEGQKRFPGTQTPVMYTFWFAVVLPTSSPHPNVYTYFHLPKAPAFLKLLKKHKIPEVFPAITERKCGAQSRCLYMAADLSDADFDPGGYKRTDVITMRRWTSPQETSNAVGSFWLLYVPFMRTWLHDIARAAKPTSQPAKRRSR
ncbi:MAG: hypothetical protein EP343_32655 [Deltaproteobacteria bacterium]|nr:MAG: hypothetical protein EP343_32655 [Deltaproteobacteria bacterium]